MNVKQIDPTSLQIDNLNERQSNVATSDLEESIEENGVIQPPMVRENGDGYKVVVGQRRTLASQAVGLDEIPVIVTEWDDVEALTASITENYEVFSESVLPKDRAQALLHLARISGDPDAFQDDEKTVPSPKWLSEKLGDVSLGAIRGWIERIRPEWEDTPIHVEHVSNGTRDDRGSVDFDKVGDKTLSEIRNATTEDDDESRMQLVEEVAKDTSDKFSQSDVQEVRRQTNRGESPDTAIENVKQAKKGYGRKETVRFEGEVASALRNCAEDRGTSNAQQIRDAVREYLKSEGYL